MRCEHVTSRTHTTAPFHVTNRADLPLPRERSPLLAIRLCSESHCARRTRSPALGEVGAAKQRPVGATPSQLPHHRLRVYRAALELLRAVRAANITDRDMREQALRAAKSVCRNIAEASGRVSPADKARVWGIARGEAVEAIATTEIAIEAGDGVAEALPLVLDRGNAVYAMLSGLCRAR